MKNDLGLTGARGFAVLYVFTYHIVTYRTLPTSILNYLMVFTSGFSGVSFFFILSAYLLTRKFMDGDYKSGTSKFSFRNYIMKRIFRIWPLYYAFLAAVIILTILGLNDYFAVDPINSLTVFFIGNLFPNTFNGNAIWTLMLEEIFYVFLPLWIILFTKVNWKYPLIGLLVITLVYRAVIPQFPFDRYYIDQIPAYLFDFALGTCLALGLNMKVKSKLSYLIFIPFVISTYFIQDNRGLWWSPLVFTPFYGFLLVNMNKSWIFTNSIIVWIGKRSYGFYLISGFMITLFANILNMTHLSFVSWTLTLEWIVFAMSGTLALSWLSFRFFEEPIRRIGRGPKTESPIIQAQID